MRREQRCSFYSSSRNGEKGSAQLRIAANKKSQASHGLRTKGDKFKTATSDGREGDEKGMVL